MTKKKDKHEIEVSFSMFNKVRVKDIVMIDVSDGVVALMGKDGEAIMVVNKDKMEYVKRL